MKLITPVLALGITLAGIGTAGAQTAAEARACYADAVRLCGVRPGQGAASLGEMIMVGNCLLWKRAVLSPRCRAVFAAHGL